MARTVVDDGHVNARGNTTDRRNRKLWLLSPHSGHGGDGVEAPCHECGTRVDYDSLIVNRIIPGSLGGRYVRPNINVHCRPCSLRQGYEMGVGSK